MPPRVLMLSWEYPPVVAGGLARHVAGLSRALADQGAEVHVITRGTPDVARDDGVRVHRVPHPPFPTDLDAFLRWVAALNDALERAAETRAAGASFDLVHGHDWLVADAGRAIARRLDLPWLVTVHATEHGRHAGRVEDHPQSAIHAAERAMARDADRLITCSRYMADHVSEALGVARTRITALRNGIEPRDPGPVVGDREPVVLLAGRLVHEKGFHVALDALAIVARARPDVRALVAGTGPAEAELRGRVRSLALEGRVRFLGWVQDERLRALYAAAAVCVVPSLYEPFGIVALEAMAAGCPLVVSDTGGLREIVNADGTVGLRVPAGDAPALAAAVTHLLGDDRLRARIGAAGAVHARGYGWSRVARDTRAVYARAVRAVAASGHG